jgi:hypothetical protein
MPRKKQKTRVAGLLSDLHEACDNGHQSLANVGQG